VFYTTLRVEIKGRDFRGTNFAEVIFAVCILTFLSGKQKVEVNVLNYAIFLLGIESHNTEKK